MFIREAFLYRGHGKKGERKHEEGYFEDGVHDWCIV